METVKLFCDRIEEGIAVLLSDDGTVYELPAKALPDSEKAEGAHYLCTVSDGKVISWEKAEETTKGENKKRLSALFGKSKKTNNKG